VLTGGELFVILDLHRQGLSVSAIARRLDLDRRRCASTSSEGWIRPCNGPRAPRPTKIDPYIAFCGIGSRGTTHRLIEAAFAAEQAGTDVAARVVLQHDHGD